MARKKRKLHSPTMPVQRQYLQFLEQVRQLPSRYLFFITTVAENESNKFVKEDIDLEGETELEEDIDLEGETELEEREAEPSVEGQGYFLEEPTDTT